MLKKLTKKGTPLSPKLGEKIEKRIKDEMSVGERGIYLHRGEEWFNEGLLGVSGEAFKMLLMESYIKNKRKNVST